MTQLTANDLKTRGVAAIESVLAKQPEAMISVRGKDRFVVMDVAHYQYLRECELDAALAQSQADLAAGRFVAESAKAHVARISAAAGLEPAMVPQTVAKKPGKSTKRPA
jgi:PHD/YefM family antitoxin component YafN of YafNO toxin-antitoxin module